MGQRIPIRKAAKEIHKSRTYVRSLIDRGLLRSYRVGGSDKEPWLEVDLDDLHEATRRDQIFIPPALKNSGLSLASAGADRPVRIRRTGRLHPAVMGMLKHDARRK